MHNTNLLTDLCQYSEEEARLGGLLVYFLIKLVFTREFRKNAVFQLVAANWY